MIDHFGPPVLGEIRCPKNSAHGRSCFIYQFTCALSLVAKDSCLGWLIGICQLRLVVTPFPQASRLC